jgi:hypothetical protein
VDIGSPKLKAQIAKLKISSKPQDSWIEEPEKEPGIGSLEFGA